MVRIRPRPDALHIGIFIDKGAFAVNENNTPRCQPSGSPSVAAPTGRPPATARTIRSNPFRASSSNQSTFYAEERMAQRTGMYMPVYGHAYQWADQARAGGWTVGAAPAFNSVVVFPRGAFGSTVGHVAWVVEVSGSRIRIQDYNWGRVGARVTDHWVGLVNGTRFIYSDR
jgi:surface antigen